MTVATAARLPVSPRAAARLRISAASFQFFTVRPPVRLISPDRKKRQPAKDEACRGRDGVAEACRNRTDPSRRSRDADGFEVREGHQTPCASDPGLWPNRGRPSRKTARDRGEAAPEADVQASSGTN